MGAWVPLLVLALLMAGCSGSGTGPTGTQAASTSAPRFDLMPDEAHGKLTVESAAGDADWHRLEILVPTCTSGATGRVAVGGATTNTHVNQVGTAAASSTYLMAAGAACGGTAVSPPERPAATTQRMFAGDTLQFCGRGSLANVKIELKDSVANFIAYTYTFTALANCT